MFKEKDNEKGTIPGPDAEPALMIDQSKDRRGLPRRLGQTLRCEIQSKKKEVRSKQKGLKACRFVLCDYFGVSERKRRHRGKECAMARW